MPRHCSCWKGTRCLEVIVAGMITKGLGEVAVVMGFEISNKSCGRFR